jgi:hypothetical protein
MFQERKVRPHRTQGSTRSLMAGLSSRFDWRTALVSRLVLARKSKPVGRAALPKSEWTPQQFQLALCRGIRVHFLSRFHTHTSSLVSSD